MVQRNCAAFGGVGHVGQQFFQDFVLIRVSQADGVLLPDTGVEWVDRLVVVFSISKHGYLKLDITPP
ncbi:MAG: hypothetical protein HC794_04370 [Nitrospiraceae bacterium]|nr:hypothetical protein [Nitrospiraceae bacterium]